MLLVSGDLKDLGRIMRVNRGVDQLLGYSPEELKGSKINKIMP
jgi:PAS domain S-box-containing protein